MSIHENAEKLLHDLTPVLTKYGEAAVTGSFYMDMMAWNDLDIYLCPDEARFDIFSLMADVNALLHPIRLEGMAQPEQGRIFYSVETMFMGERWNVDIWVKSREEIRESLEYCASILRRVQEESELKEIILSVKRRLISMQLYGFDKHHARHYHSVDVYSAVLNESVRSPEEFLLRHPL